MYLQPWLPVRSPYKEILVTLLRHSESGEVH